MEAGGGIRAHAHCARLVVPTCLPFLATAPSSGAPSPCDLLKSGRWETRGLSLNQLQGSTEQEPLKAAGPGSLRKPGPLEISLWRSSATKRRALPVALPH